MDRRSKALVPGLVGGEAVTSEVDITIARPSVGIGERSDVHREVEEASVDLRRLLGKVILETETDVHGEGSEEVRL